jgi:3' terminal RNA ribose 2'-O-methyltransferase Hen1
MLLTITTTHKPATDLGYLLHKHPDKLQTFELSAGEFHIFYPEANEERCTAAILLEIDAVGLVHNSKSPSGEGFALEQYVNDRPYVASSFMSSAIAKGLSSALNGSCKQKPELVTHKLPFEVKISVMPARGGESFLRKLFEPLGYELQLQRHPLDEQFPEWGESRYFTVVLKHTITLKELLTHLYVLIPVLDNNKHYWVSENEVQKLLEKGEGWLASHPEKEQITKRYLRHRKGLMRQAMEVLLKDEAPEVEKQEEAAADAKLPEEKQKLHDVRLSMVAEKLVRSGASRVMDLGCGEGKLLKLLMAEKQFEEILGMDVSWRALEIARDKLHLDNAPERVQKRIKLIQGSLMYKDKRLVGYDAAAVVEVIEHLDPPRLAAFERILFEFSHPSTVVITTPNAEYNVKYESLSAGVFRHSDHRFEWTRKEFDVWAQRICDRYAYDFKHIPVGPFDPEVGAPSQMGVFTVR